MTGGRPGAARPHGGAPAARPGRAAGPAARPARGAAPLGRGSAAAAAPDPTRRPRSAGRLGSARSTPPRNWPGLGLRRPRRAAREGLDSSARDHARELWQATPRLAAGGRAAALAFPPALLGLGVGAGCRPGPGQPPAPVRAAVAILAVGGHLRPRRRLASLPGGAARLVVVRAYTGTWSRAATLEPCFVAGTVGARRVPAPAPRNRCRRQPPDQEPQGAGRAGRVLRRRRGCWTRRSTG